MHPEESALRKSLERMLTEAAARTSVGKAEDASRSYARAAQFATQIAEIHSDPGEAEAMRIRAMEYRSRATAMAKGRMDTKRCRPDTEADPEDREARDEDDDALEQRVLALIDESPRNLDWNQVGGLDSEGNELKFHYGLALAKRPEGLEVEGWNNVMLYGPPGTGKTLLAGALSRNLGATFFNVKASQIVSKWVGESGRLIAALYRLARRFSREGPPSVVFIDEFDALCQDRGRETPLHHRQMLASILSELDGFVHKGRGDREGRVLTLGATNRPWDLDPAVLSRFERRMLIPLPEASARERIFRIHLEARGLALQNAETLYPDLAHRATRLSGREIARLCKEAATRMLTEMNADIPALVDRGIEALQAHTLRLRPLSVDDFLPLLHRFKPDTDESENERYRQWGSDA